MFRHMVLSMYVPVYVHLVCDCIRVRASVFMCRNTHVGACVSASLCMFVSMLV